MTDHNRKMPTRRRPDDADPPKVAFRTSDGPYQTGSRAPDDAAEVIVLADRSPASYRNAIAVSGETRERLGPDAQIDVRRTPLPIPGGGWADHVASMAMLAGAQPTVQEAIARLESFDAARAERSGIRTAADVLFDLDARVMPSAHVEPPALEWTIQGFLPRAIEAGLIAPGGTGKGIFELSMGIHVATGTSWGTFEILRPQPVVFLCLEDDEEELQRRASAVLRKDFEDMTPEQEEILHANLHIKPLRGVLGANLIDDGFVDKVVHFNSMLHEPPALVILDPLMRGIRFPEGQGINAADAAGIAMNQIGRVIHQGGRPTFMFAHHMNKFAMREGREFDPTAATGSQQLVDLSRVAYNMKTLARAEVEAYGLPEGGRYVEVQASKANFPTPERRMVFEIEKVSWSKAESVALTWHDVAERSENERERVLAVIVRVHEELGRPVTDKELLDNRGSIAVNTMRTLRNKLIELKLVTRHRERDEDGKGRDRYAPVEHARRKLAAMAAQDAENMDAGM